jgi:hypothetical protein
MLDSTLDYRYIVNVRKPFRLYTLELVLAYTKLLRPILSK